jgi:glutathione reductase (NADPH)
VTYDLIVIGTGTAARVASARVRSAGWSVAVIDHRPFGGTCALRGCDPKKVLVGASEVVDLVDRMAGRGIVGKAGIDWPELMAFKRRFTDPVPQHQEHYFARNGIDAFHGAARFVAPHEIELDGQRLEARHVLLASGARPAPLGFPGEQHLATSDAFLELDRLPARLVLVGGGFIAAEFCHIAASAGVAVTVLQRGPRMLRPFDPDLVGWLTERLRSMGIDIRTETTVKAIERTTDVLRVLAKGPKGEAAIEADLVVHAAGRIPDLDALDLAAGDVAVQDGRLHLNEFLQSVSNPAVYAAGDAAQAGPPLTPVASHDGDVVAANLLNANSRRPDYRGVPAVAFTLPPIASVGLDEKAARQQNLKVKVNCAKASDWYTARRRGESVYGYKTIVEHGSGRILGAHLVGPHAEDTINIFAMAIRNRISADDLKASIFAYPTAASDISHML